METTQCGLEALEENCRIQNEQLDARLARLEAFSGELAGKALARARGLLR